MTEHWDISAEAHIIGAMIVDPDCIAEVRTILPASDMFWRSSHQHIYAAVLDLAGADTDPVTITDAVRRAGKLDECGGPEALRNTLIEYASGLPSSFGVERQAAIVRDHWRSRAAIRSAQALINQVGQAGADSRATLSRAAHHFAELAMDHDTQDPRNISTFVREAQEASQAGGIGGVPSPWASLDEITTCWKPGQLVVVAAGTGVGKSAFAAAVAAHNLDSGVLLFSLEMLGREIAARMICSQAGIDSRRYDLGKLSVYERDLCGVAAARLAGNLWIDDTAAIDVAGLRSKALRWKARHDISLVIVDYLGLIDERIEGSNRVQVVGAISRGLKLLAMEARVPVLALHQLNRDHAKEKREPKLHDLRDSGSVEQDANQVILLHRVEQGEGTDKIKVKIAKNRGGPISHVMMNFERKTTRFLEIADV